MLKDLKELYCPVCGKLIVERQMIKKVKEGYKVVSEKGKNLGTSKTKEGAKKRLAQVEYFKRAKQK